MTRQYRCWSIMKRPGRAVSDLRAWHGACHTATQQVSVDLNTTDVDIHIHLYVVDVISVGRNVQDWIRFFIIFISPFLFTAPLCTSLLYFTSAFRFISEHMHIYHLAHCWRAFDMSNKYYLLTYLHFLHPPRCGPWNLEKEIVDLWEWCLLRFLFMTLVTKSYISQ